MATSFPTVQLDATGVPTLVVEQSAGFYGQLLDLGDAVTRAVVDDAVDADGTDDATEHFGARNVTLKVTLFPDSGEQFALKQALRSFTHPRLRPVMTVQQSADAPLQRIVLRRSQFTDILGDDPRESGDGQELTSITVQWVAPLGILESALLHSATANASGDGTIDGLIAPIVAPIVLGASEPTGSVDVVNAGTADVYPLVRLYGPCEGPVLVHEEQDRALVFDDAFTIAAGDFVEVDFRAHRVLYNGNPADSRYNALAFPDTKWWALQQGSQRIRYQPVDFSSPAQAVIEWRDAWL